MIHLLAEAAEMRPEEEVAMDRRHVADGAARDQAADAARRGKIAAVLNDDMQPVGGAGAGDEVARLVERIRHRLFGQDMAAGGERGGNDMMPGAGHDDVEQDVRLGLREEVLDTGRDHDVAEAEFRGARSGAVRVDIGDTDDLKTVDRLRGLEPGATHGSAAD